MDTTKKEIEVIDISTQELRNSLGEIFDRVQYGGSTFVVKRKGKEVGAIVPVELAREIEQALAKRGDARERLFQMLEERTDLNSDLSEETAMDIATRAVEDMRGKNTKPARK